jgi:hypothetical protein
MLAIGSGPAAAHARQLKESRRTPTTPSLRRGQTERYGPTLIGRAEACEGGFQVPNALPAQNARPLATATSKKHPSEQPQP